MCNLIKKKSDNLETSSWCIFTEINKYTQKKSLKHFYSVWKHFSAVNNFENIFTCHALRVLLRTSHNRLNDVSFIEDRKKFFLINKRADEIKYRLD